MMNACRVSSELLLLEALSLHCCPQLRLLIINGPPSISLRDRRGISLKNYFREALREAVEKTFRLLV
jgi:hypothetical protein